MKAASSFGGKAAAVAVSSGYSNLPRAVAGALLLGLGEGGEGAGPGYRDDAIFEACRPRFQ